MTNLVHMSLYETGSKGLAFDNGSVLCGILRGRKFSGEYYTNYYTETDKELFDWMRHLVHEDGSITVYLYEACASWVDWDEVCYDDEDKWADVACCWVTGPVFKEIDTHLARLFNKLGFNQVTPEYDDDGYNGGARLALNFSSYQVENSTLRKLVAVMEDVVDLINNIQWAMMRDARRPSELTGYVKIYQPNQKRYISVKGDGIGKRFGHGQIGAALADIATNIVEPDWHIGYGRWLILFDCEMSDDEINVYIKTAHDIDLSGEECIFGDLEGACV